MANRFQLPNLPYIRQDDSKYGSAFAAIQDAIGNLSDQANADPTSTANGVPASINAFNVVEASGIHDLQIQDEAPANRGKSYFADYSDTPDFQNYHTIHLGPSQNHRANLGPGVYHWRAYSSYSTTSHSTPVVFGGAKATPVGSGAMTGPPMQAKQGSLGYGPVYKNSNVPPVRR